ncbi:MAG: hypothetical protein HKM93_06970 [Desulfobacteraceae bacterium]|nr:hypothetical protein [Desulfobacteraceae bacterium]
MKEMAFDPLAMTLLILLTITVYVVINIVFLSARRKYLGGVIEKVINMIIATIGLFLVADVSLFLIPMYGFQIGYTVHVAFKIMGMCSLAIGGLKFFIR